MGIMGLFAALFLILFAGFIVTIFYKDRLVMQLACAYPLGVGFVTLQLFFYSVFSIPFKLPLIFLPWFLVGLFLILIKFKQISFAGFNTKNMVERYTLFEKMLLFIIFFQISFALINSIILPIKGFDTWVIWFLKGKAFYMDGGVKYDFFLKELYSNGNASYQYPLLAPLLVTLGYLALGYVDDQLVKIFFSLYYVSLLFIFYYFLLSITSREISLLLTAMLATVPRVMQQAGIDGVGYADLPLSVYFLIGVGFGYRYIVNADKKALLLAVISFSIAAWTKNEGLTMLVAAIIILSFHIFYKDKTIGIKTFFGILVITLFIALPWQLYKYTLPELSATMVSDLSFKTFISNIGRVPFILQVILPKLFTANKYHITWGLYVLITIVSLRKLKSAGYLYIQTLMWFQSACYIFVYVLTPFELKGHIATSIDRLTIHLLPIGYLCVGVLWADFTGRLQRYIVKQK